MIRGFSFYIINVLLLVTFFGCKRDPLDVDISGIPLDISIHRFDRELFTLDMDTVESAIPHFYDTYGDFFDVFNVHVINIGPASAKYYPSYLSMFVNDPLNREVYEYTQEVFPEMNEAEQELTGAFRRYLYHFPDSTVPGIVAYVSRFNQKLITVGNYIGIGLDQYLGRDCRYYKQLQYPVYMQHNAYKKKIASDVVIAWGGAKFPYHDSVDNVLNRMIYQGQLMYFADALLPEMSDSLKIGFTADQIRFCRNNERQMWQYLIEHKMLFSTDMLTIRKLTEPAPSTQYFPSESPGRAAVWIGWQIVREYARRNPQLTVQEIVTGSDYQRILSEARYDP